MIRVDLNCDLGESPERIDDGTDDRILAGITSANIACGGHAGDARTMEALVRLARAHGVAVGAHPSFPDPASFGRARLHLPVREIEDLVERQVRALDEIARRLLTAVSHVKPHGGLYHAAREDDAVAAAVARGAARVREGLILVGQAGSTALAVWRGMGFATAGEAFADRAYEGDGTLRSRTEPEALLADPEEAAAQALRIAKDGQVVARDGTLLRVRAETLCIHGDTPGADRIALAVRGRLEAAGIELRPLGT